MSFIKKIKFSNPLTKVIIPIVFLIFSSELLAQTCCPSSLYGWATENGGTTGGEGGSSVVVTTMSQLNSELAKSGKLIIYVQGTLTGTAKVSSDKTIFGLPGANIQGNMELIGISNVIIKNLIVRGEKCPDYNTCKAGYDAVHLEQGTHNVWLDHMDIADGQDGNCDITHACDFITISWTKFSYTYIKEHAFSNLNGHVDNNSEDIGKLNITFHHNWWADNIQERQPRIRYGKIHVANNLYTSTMSDYIVGVGFNAKTVVEGNIMKTSATPISYFPGGVADNVLTRNNLGPAAANAVNGTAFVPPYQMAIDVANTNLEAVLRQCAGATLSDPRNTPTVAVIAPANNSSFCSGTSITLTADASELNGTISKVEFYDGTTLLGTATTSPYTYNWVNPGSGNHAITAKATDLVCASKTSTAVSITINANPSSVPAVSSPVTYCQNVTASALSATGTSLKWYTVPTNGTGSVIAPIPSTTTTGTTSYYVSQTVNGCESSRATIAVSISTAPSSPIVTTPVTYCQNSTAAALSATGTSLKWYTVPTNGIGSVSAPIPLTTTTGTTSYYVSQAINGCESSRATIVVSISTAPSSPIVTTPVTYCQNSTATALSADGISLKWYTVSTNGTGSAIAPIPSTTTTGTTSYYVSQIVNGCESARATIAVIVNAVSSAPSVTTPVTYCQNSSASALSSTGTLLKWYTVSTNGSGSATAPVPTTTTTGTTSYYVSQTVSGCESARAVIAVVINEVPIASITAGGKTTLCAGESVTLTASTGSSYRWFATNMQVGTDPTYTATTTGIYTVEVTNAWGCKSTSAATLVSVTDLPFALITSGGSTNLCQGGSVTLTASAGSSYKWFEGTTQVGTNQTYTATAPGKYTVQVTSAAGCTTISQETIVTVTIMPTPEVFPNGPTTFCQGGNVTLSTGSASSYIWYNETNQVSTDATYTTNSSGSYKVQITNGSGCQATSDVIVVTVNLLPSASIIAGGPTTFTQGGSVVLNANQGTGFTYIWFNGSSQVGTGSTYTATSGGNYSVEVTNASGCRYTSSPISVTVNPPINQAPVVSITSPLNNAIFIAPANVLITAIATDPDGTVNKVDFYNGTTLLATDPTSTYNFALNNLPVGSYTLIAKATDNEGAVTTSVAINITVNPNQPSVINIVSPTNNSTVVGPSVTIDVNATDPDGSITKVEYLDGNTVIGTSTTQPYSFTWSNPTAGTHVITVKVTDSNGGVTTSSSTVTVGTGTGIIASSYGVFTHVYPNPSLESFTIKASKGIKSLSVINMYGEEVITLQDVSADQQVEIGKDLEDGTYVLLIQYVSDKMEVAKLVKVK